ncbi:MAG: penicillin acylase family protein, partial [Acidobacteriota bacterium]|nr:penicillin acylase family protein [Acidobacteriota bacterium]
MKTAFVFTFSFLILFNAQTSAAQTSNKLARSVTIYRDAFGVPHIYGRDDASAVFGLMYAQAE